MYREGTIKFSIDMDKFILDVDRKGLVKGLKTIAAFEFFTIPKPLNETGVTIKDLLKNITKVFLNVRYIPNFVVVKFEFISKIKQKEQPIEYTVIAPYGKELAVT